MERWFPAFPPVASLHTDTIGPSGRSVSGWAFFHPLIGFERLWDF
ncbi:hypothetical protein D3OALGB2SA_5621 [Olavius algarvensis associated proteobacterium Delta 3]|nr:hypothetical protein D3OALGB2SA_5621 [Olavius algarvensis associated proteobacterium Delta 3]